jgi:hypothetical protein
VNRQFFQDIAHREYIAIAELDLLEESLSGTPLAAREGIFLEDLVKHLEELPATVDG